MDGHIARGPDSGIPSGAERSPSAADGLPPLARNASALYLAHALGLLVPLLTVPYLARVLRPEGWGLVVFAQSFGAWSALVLEYGFDLSGTRQVSRLRGDPVQISRFVSAVQGARLLVLLAYTLVVLAIGVTFRPQSFQEGILLWAWFFAVCRGLTPSWYFFGMERMIRPALVEAGGRILPALAVFIWIRGPGDEWRVLALQAAGAAGVLVLLTGDLYGQVSFRRPTWRSSLEALRQGSGAFLFRAASGLYLQANGLIVGVLSTPQAVAFFGGAEKVIRAGINVFQPLSQALFPRSSYLLASDRRAAGSLLKASFLVFLFQGLLMMAVALLAAPWLIRVILGPGYESAIPVLRLMAALPPIIAVGTVFGIHWALAAGFERPFVVLVLVGAAANVFSAVLLVPRWGAVGMAIAVLSAEVVVALGLLALFRQAGGRFKPFTPPGKNT